jgi:hypothetical protein
MTEMPSYDELVALLNNGGEICFEFDEKYRKRFRRNVDRLNRLQVSLRYQSTLGKAFSCIYGAYVGLMQILGTSSNDELDHAVLVYQVAWRHMAPIEGEILSNGNIRVTFRGRT